eukprot:CAMPEP_0113296962 /NCGR_PEP_ID=MMETSP0010_2-20120614/25_1 /TAXON_ID=216773 ORGANISM="Corethron hystrix, Strain 308" /NCGR_SAMPLE_ID=MMETSP0010_2 /ASSEMBLY_ACC=CAM_ASM_000155 /LENGTH=755 /DNA_ID=CAMNT_0000149777 /DNA_START=566 /DNA_END=2830 /DNA_ORIENTATION=- /assembly_acc=CAM_ASM_000155
MSCQFDTGVESQILEKSKPCSDFCSKPTTASPLSIKGYVEDINTVSTPSPPLLPHSPEIHSSISEVGVEDECSHVGPKPKPHSVYSAIPQLKMGTGEAFTSAFSRSSFDSDGRGFECLSRSDSRTPDYGLSEQDERQSPPRTPIVTKRLMLPGDVSCPSPIRRNSDRTDIHLLVSNSSPLIKSTPGKSVSMAGSICKGNKKSPRSLNSFARENTSATGGTAISTSKIDRQSGRTTIYSDRFIPSRSTTRYGLMSPHHVLNHGGVTPLVARDMEHSIPAPAIDGDFFNPSAQISYNGSGVRRSRNHSGGGMRRRLIHDFDEGMQPGARGGMGRMNPGDDGMDEFGNNDPSGGGGGGGNGAGATSSGNSGMGSGSATNELHLNVLLRSELLGAVDYRNGSNVSSTRRVSGSRGRRQGSSSSNFRRNAYNFDHEDGNSPDVSDDFRHSNGSNVVRRPTGEDSRFSNLLQFQSLYRLNRQDALEMGDNVVRTYDENFYSGGTSLPFLSTFGNRQLLSSSSRLLSGMTDSNYQHLAASLGQQGNRRIPKIPFKVLDAPSLQDDFYLNLVDWSSLNVLAVGLGSCVYLWSAFTSKVTKLCDLGESDDSVTSVAWTQRGTHLSVGTNLGEVQLWDVSSCKKIRTMKGHTARVGTMAWNEQFLASGSRDRSIYLRDVRCDEPYTSKLTGHKQEICGLKWSFDEVQLASGGNDNKLFIWDLGSSQPVNRFNEHTAAVKAIAWSPHQHGLLASGGGTADRCIRFW